MTGAAAAVLAALALVLVGARRPSFSLAAVVALGAISLGVGDALARGGVHASTAFALWFCAGILVARGALTPLRAHAALAAAAAGVGASRLLAPVLAAPVPTSAEAALAMVGLASGAVAIFGLVALCGAARGARSRLLLAGLAMFSLVDASAMALAACVGLGALLVLVPRGPSSTRSDDGLARLGGAERR